MLRVDVFRGDAAEAAAFCTSVWRAACAGRGFYPDWGEAYMRRQLTELPDPDRVLCLGAYAGERLVGFFAAEEMDFHTPCGATRGTMSSWLSVASDSGLRGVATRMQSAMWDWQAARGAAFMIGFVNAGLVRGKGRRFWTSRVPGATVYRRPGLWAAVLSPAAAARAQLSAAEAWGTRALAALRQPARRVPGTALRAYEPSDLTACRALFEAADDASFGYRWPQPRLAHQLAPRDGSRCLVLIEDGAVAGFVAVSRLDVIGRARLRCAVLDFLVVGAGARSRAVAFLRSCLSDLALDFDAALTLGPPVHDAAILWRAGMIPLPPSQAMIHLPVDPHAAPLPPGRLRVHWR